MTDLRVVLELSLGPEVVPCGQLIAAAEAPVPFAGWIELAAMLERALVAARPSPPGLSHPAAPD